MKKSKIDDLSLVKLYFSEKSQIYKKLDFKKILDLVNQINNTYKKDGTIFIMGNGGSSGIAEGFSVDLRTHPCVSEDKNKTTTTR
jgi:phosphoheptose isomerase